ncbi:YicC family protein [Candidatus Palibaumannia cicadellinicola]|uniref:YicC family protein n=1 Tax=Candidatus Palibaumannia cicadellinicola TaxID=186490 RepID=A0A2N4XX34_9GAMM|nr:YicC/YloC family endoribonuclease [Candidatus Baumannia cicadellinicola]PLK58766.1 YicC family protein [Candidatus Baumannia cicadellinicola]
MIRSMTAYARRDMKETWGTATWELRSVNQRYLETYISLPELFRKLEPTIRNYIRTFLTRGKVECHLCVNVNLQMPSALILNDKLTKKLIEAAQWVKMQSNEGEIDPLAILRWPGVIVTTEQTPDIDTMSPSLLSCLDATLHDFIRAREIEGIALKTMIERRLAGVSAEITKVRQQMPDILVWQKNKLLGKLEEAQVKLDNDRQVQELVMLAQRSDIAEELERLETHIKETYHILTNKEKEAVGRRLDFMMQEFYRESNTLASKSINASVTASAIELKVLIEQMREQIQNIE